MPQQNYNPMFGPMGPVDRKAIDQARQEEELDKILKANGVKSEDEQLDEILKSNGVEVKKPSSFTSRALETGKGFVDFAGTLMSNYYNPTGPKITEFAEGMIDPIKELGNTKYDPRARVGRMFGKLAGANPDAIEEDYDARNYGALAGDIAAPVALAGIMHKASSAKMPARGALVPEVLPAETAPRRLGAGNAPIEGEVFSPEARGMKLIESLPKDRAGFNRFPEQVIEGELLDTDGGLFPQGQLRLDAPRKTNIGLLPERTSSVPDFTNNFNKNLGSQFGDVIPDNRLAFNPGGEIVNPPVEQKPSLFREATNTVEPEVARSLFNREVPEPLVIPELMRDLTPRSGAFNLRTIEPRTADAFAEQPRAPMEIPFGSNLHDLTPIDRSTAPISGPKPTPPPTILTGNDVRAKYGKEPSQLIKQGKLVQTGRNQYTETGTATAKPTSKTLPEDDFSGLKDNIRTAHAGADPSELFSMLKDKLSSFGASKRAPFTGRAISPELLNTPQGDIIKFLQNAKPLREAQDVLNRKTRGERFSAADSVTATGEAGARQRLGAQAGEFPKVGFEPIRGNFAPEQINNLYDLIEQAEIGRGDKNTAVRGLGKILDPVGSTIPQPSEMRAIAKIFGKEFTDHIYEAHAGLPLPALTRNMVVDALNVPKSGSTSMDVSFPLRQGAALSHVTKTLPDGTIVNAMKDSLEPMFKAFKSEEAAKAYEAAMEADPRYEYFDPHNENKIDIGLTKVASDTSRENMLARDELFGSQLAHKFLPWTKWSERSFNTAGNRLRFDAAVSIMEEMKKSGIEFSRENLDRMGKYVRNASGRGDLPGFLGKIPAELNLAFFSPKFIASRFHMLRPDNYINLAKTPMDKVMRKHYLKSALSLVKLYGIVASVPLAFSLLRDDKEKEFQLETNPLSTDFLKPRSGNIRLDPMTGLQQPIVRGAQFITGKQQKVDSDEDSAFGQGGRTQPLARFLRSKLSPTAAYILDMMEGKDYLGNKFQFGPRTMNLFTPMIANDLWELVKEDPELAVALAPLKIGGVGGQTFNQTNIWQDAFGMQNQRGGK